MGRKEKQGGPRPYRVMLILGIILMLIALMYVFAFEVARNRPSQLSAYSDDWDDISDLRRLLEDKGYETQSIFTSPTMLSEVEDPEKTLFISMGVELNYTYTENYMIRQFVEKGGNMLMADDFGYGSETMKRFGSRFYMGDGSDRTPARLFDQNYDMELGYDFINVTVRWDYFQGTVLFNKPTAFESWMGRAIGTSSPSSFMDINANMIKDPGEPLGIYSQFPVMVETNADFDSAIEGSAVFISDSSLFINEMLDQADNQRFAEDLVTYLLGDPDRDDDLLILFDESRHFSDSPMDNARGMAYRALIMSTTDFNWKILTGVIVVLSFMIAVVYVDNPTQMHHTFNLNFTKLENLRDPYVTAEDAERIRVMFLERVRLSHGLSLDEFRGLDTGELADLIRDDELIEFALDWEREWGGVDLERVLIKIQRWSD